MFCSVLRPLIFLLTPGKKKISIFCFRRWFWLRAFLTHSLYFMRFPRSQKCLLERVSSPPSHSVQDYCLCWTGQCPKKPPQMETVAFLQVTSSSVAFHFSWSLIWTSHATTMALVLLHHLPIPSTVHLHQPLKNSSNNHWLLLNHLFISSLSA